jgi:L-ascorbate metabolism protein UlaG (beta-lactamase superfamily)
MVEAGMDVGRIDVPRVGETTVHGDGLKVTAIPSAHYEHEPDEQGNPAYLGFVIELNGVTFYHAGDTIIYEGMMKYLERWEIDLAYLPINGRDWFREQQGLVGNLNYREAAELAAQIGAKVLLPGHNDMFSGNRENPAILLDYLTSKHPRQRVHFLQAGELYYYVKQP